MITLDYIFIDKSLKSLVNILNRTSVSADFVSGLAS